ncbi:MAG: VOC family protein [Oscillospiraceae bacterium]|nr:VOC family protein [Oscillospiraceae bacterium]
MNEIGKRVTGLQHIGIPTNNMAATVKFYHSLGFETVHETSNNGETVCFLRLANICIEAYENGKAAEKAGAIDHIALDVDDIEAAWKAVRSAGYQTRETEIQTLPFWSNGVRFFNIQGPNGETVEFGQIL